MDKFIRHPKVLFSTTTIYWRKLIHFTFLAVNVILKNPETANCLYGFDYSRLFHYSRTPGE